MKTLVAYVPGRNNYNFDFLPKHKGASVNLIENNKADRILNFNLYKEKLAFARDEGCSNLSIVGYGEPLLNQPYLEMINTLNNQLSNPFSWIELKTNGSSFLKEGNTDLDFLRHTGVKTIVVYLTSFEDYKNHQLMTGGGSTNEAKIDIKLLCEKIKEYGYNLRLEVFLTKWLEYLTIADIIKYTNELKPDQVTLSKLLTTGEDNKADTWIRSNGCQPDTITRVQEELSERKIIGITSTGYNIYSINNISFVLNDGSKVDEDLGNMYLLPNARLYRQPDNLGSLIF